MENPKRRRRTIHIILLVIGAVLLAGGFALWVLYQLFPTWFPQWFNKLFVILAGLAVLISVVGAALSDLFLPLWDRLRSRDGSRVWELAEKTPMRQVGYDTLVARLGRSGKIPWIDRDATSASLLREHGRVAIVGWMKSGKTREAAELIRRTLEDGWISQVYEPTSALDLIDQEALASAIATQLDSRQRCLFLVDELGLRPEMERLGRLSTCIKTISKARPDAYFLITIQRERLVSPVQAWLEEHQFHLVTLPTMTPVQRRELVGTAAKVLGVAVSDGAMRALASQTDGRPYSIVFALQRVTGTETLSTDSVRELLTRSEDEAWAEQRRQIKNAEPAASPLLESIATFVSAGVTPRETGIRRYADYLITSDSPGGKTARLLDAAAERWSRFDIVAAEGLYTIPEPLLLPLLINVDEARSRLSTFVEAYDPGFLLSFATALLRPLDVLLRLEKLQLQWFRLSSKLRSSWRTATRSLRLSRIGFVLKLPSTLMRAIERRFRFPEISLRLTTWLTETLFSWPTDRALLSLELGSETKRTEYLSSIALAQRGMQAALAGDYATALDCLDKALALNIANFPALYNRGSIYLRMDRYEEALADLDRAIELNPDDDGAIALRGSTYGSMGRYEEALADLDRAVELGPDYAWAIARRGEICILVGRYEEALGDVERAIKLDPDYAGAIALRGSTYGLMGRHEEALADFDRAIKLDPDEDWYLYSRALTYQALGQTDEAQQDLTAAIWRAQEKYRKEPKNWNNALCLALCHLAAGEAKKAEQIYRDFLSAKPSRWHIRMAVRDLRIFLALFPHHTQAIAVRDLLQEHLEESER